MRSLFGGKAVTERLGFIPTLTLIISCVFKVRAWETRGTDVMESRGIKRVCDFARFL
jgi:hypothetical protein